MDYETEPILRQIIVTVRGKSTLTDTAVPIRLLSKMTFSLILQSPPCVCLEDRYYQEVWTSGLQVAVARTPDRLRGLAWSKKYETFATVVWLRVCLSGTSRDSYLLLSSTSTPPRCPENLTTSTGGVLSWGQGSSADWETVNNRICVRRSRQQQRQHTLTH